MKLIFLILSFALLFSCKQQYTNKEVIINKEDSKPQGFEFSTEIIPGERLGNITINENSKPILDSLGKADFGDAAMGKAVTSWNIDSGNLLSLYTVTKMGIEDFSRIKAIRSLSSNYRTDENIGVNSSLSEIEKYFNLEELGSFTKDEKSYKLYTTEEGIGFEFGDDQKCHGIVLTEKGKNPLQNYLTFYPEFLKIK